MFITVFGQKGGVAKTCTSVHLAAIWAHQHKRVALIDADRNRSATAYGSRELLPYPVVPIEAAAKVARGAEVVVTDGQASSNEEELKNLVEGSDIIVLPTTPQSRSLELTVEMSTLLNQYRIPYAALLVKVDSRKSLQRSRRSTSSKDLTFTYLIPRSHCSVLLRVQKPMASQWISLLTNEDEHILGA